MLNITYKDRKTNNWVRVQTKVMDIMEIIKNRKWTWAGHISHSVDELRHQLRWSVALMFYDILSDHICDNMCNVM